MLTRTILFVIVFITTVQYQNLIVNSLNSNAGICSCDLNKGVCDVPCCCDTDCSTDDMKTFNCSSNSKENTNTISSKPITQSTCFKDLSIYKSNSPHVIQKKDDLVCVDHEKDIGTKGIAYEKLINQEIDPSLLPRSINVDNSVSSPYGTAINLTLYQAGASVFRYLSTSNTTTYYSLPVKAFNSPTCSGFQPITFLNDFTSTCTQLVNEQTCNDALDTNKYLNNSFCLIKDPQVLANGNGTYDPVCCSDPSLPTSPSSYASGTCINPLQTLDLTIYYSNPGGIRNCTVRFTPGAASSTTVQQTFTVRFRRDGSVLATSVRSGNPGYLPEAPIIAGHSNGNSITNTEFTIFQASSSGTCSSANRKLIRFGQNIQSTCLYSPTTPATCPSTADLTSIFTPYNTSALYVAAYGNPDSSNITGYWLPVTYCTSEIGSSVQPTCQPNSAPTPLANECYIRLDIQIAYANIGSVTNSQPILGAVVFHFQRIPLSSATSSLLMTQTVTFQDISNSPATDGDLISQPNTRIPGDFFYAFTLNQATNSVVFSSFFYLLIFSVFFLM